MATQKQRHSRVPVFRAYRMKNVRAAAAELSRAGDTTTRRENEASTSATGDPGSVRLTGYTYQGALEADKILAGVRAREVFGVFDVRNELEIVND